MIATLKSFTTETLFDATSALLSKLNIEFDRETAEPIDVAELYDSPMPKYLTEALQAIDKTYFIGIVNDQSLAGNKSNDSLDDVAETIEHGGKYDGMFIFACDASHDATLTRTAASALTRAFNRIACANPVILVIRQGNLLSLATCERMEYSQAWRQGSGEKLGKVTMLRNINCANLHAGHRQILERVAEDVKGSNTFEELYNNWMASFCIDILSDAFFKGYKEIYEDIIEYATGKRMVKEGSKWVERDNHNPCAEIMTGFAGFADPEKAVRDYVKNLMGRLVFIQFLQKKKWMGVPAGDIWEGGDPYFLQNLFANSDKKETFIDDVLEPLFNDLNTKRHGDLVTNYNVGVNIKVPYLNGGLFELDESDDTKFALPSRFLDKLFNFFASYNFTIDENAPDNVEIGVDPEMLGRIFENLLEDNKEKGAFYTPKEIVQYMCRESLIEYLTTCVMKKQGEKHKPEEEIREAVRKLLSEPEVIVPRMKKESREDFDKYIREVKICDPAIGSGAFPMGLLNELVRCRASIDAWAKDDYGNLLVEDYAALKAEIICNNIYGVDIEKGAIDIARLRFWLSIIVDLKVPHALPNFDYKFMQGNSLITTFNGVYVNLDTKNQKHIRVNDMNAEKKKLYGFKQQYYGSQGEKKHELAVEIKKSILRLVSMQIGYELRSWYDKNVSQRTFNFNGDSNNVTFDEIKSQLPQEKQELVNHAEELYKQLNNSGVDIAKRAQIDISFFDWRMMFTEVFDMENGGFDIVIGNPPYIQLQTDIHRKGIDSKGKEYDMKLGDLYKECNYATFEKTGDIYCIFYEHGTNLLKKKGVLCFITSNKWMRAGYGKTTRNYFAKKCNPKLLLDFTGTKIFDNATVDVNIILLSNDKNIKQTKCAWLSEPDCINDLYTAFNSKCTEIAFASSDAWTILPLEDTKIKRKIELRGKPLGNWDLVLTRGVGTGFDEAYVLNEEQKEGLLNDCSTEEELERTKSIIHPMLRGREISKYNYSWGGLWMVYIPTHFPLQNNPGIKGASSEAENKFEELYPSVYKHIFKYKEKLSSRDKTETGIRYEWYCMQRARYEKFGKLGFTKIIYQELSQGSTFAFDEGGVYMLNNSAYYIHSQEYDKYLIALLNSKLIEYAYSTYYCTRLGKTGVRWLAQNIVNLPIATANKEMQTIIESLVDRILSAKKANPLADTTAEEREIDRLVYDLYGLTEDEIAIVEGTRK